jgi:hypothetical protein|tara:strand:+ start:6245 stop:6481 length:237 start_codon:yes stop_codon:yes gene_type:complete
MRTFETSKNYGNDLTIKVLKRTAKTVTIETTAWGVSKVKVRDYGNGSEYISFKAWLITSDDIFDSNEAKELAIERAYY